MLDNYLDKEEKLENSRHFVDLPEIIAFDDLIDHLEELEKVEITEIELDGILEMWLEFKFRKHKFFVRNELGDYMFFVKDENCPEPILLEIVNHFRLLLE